MGDFQSIIDCVIGKKTIIRPFVNLYGCTIGEHCSIGPFVEIQKGVKIGNSVKIQSHTFICEEVFVEDNVFIGHHVVFTNDKYPRSTNTDGSSKKSGDWRLLRTVVKKGASIGSNVTILPGLVIGEGALIGAGSVVTKDVLPDTTVVGNPAKIISRSGK